MDNFSKIVGLYWYCSDWHSGMSSWQYRVLSTSNYRPSALTSGVSDEQDEEAQEYYNKLVHKFEIDPQAIDFLNSLSSATLSRAKATIALLKQQENPRTLIKALASVHAGFLTIDQWVECNRIYKLYEQN